MATRTEADVAPGSRFLVLVWPLAALATIALCAAAGRGDREVAAVRPVMQLSVDGAASRQTRAR